MAHGVAPWQAKIWNQVQLMDRNTVSAKVKLRLLNVDAVVDCCIRCCLLQRAAVNSRMGIPLQPATYIAVGVIYDRL